MEYSVVGSCENALDVHSKFTKYLIEFLLYFSLAIRIFAKQVGVLAFEGLSGGLIILSGIVCLTIMLIRNEKLCFSLFVAASIVVIANIVNLKVENLLEREIIFWACILLMVYFIFKDDVTVVRMSIFLAICIVSSVYIGGSFFKDSSGFSRLNLDKSVGSMFANANDLAQVSMMIGVILLFYSRKILKTLKPICLILSISMFCVVLLTLSRQGLLMTIIGIAAFVLTIKFGEEKKTIIFIAICVLTVSYLYSDQIGNIFDGYYYRFQTDSQRLSYWEVALSDMKETFFYGQGGKEGYSSLGIRPHSTFLYLHYAFGAFVAFIYAIWLLYLTRHMFMIVRSDNIEFTDKMEKFTYLLLFMLAQFTTVFAPSNYGFIMAIGIIERHKHRLEN